MFHNKDASRRRYGFEKKKMYVHVKQTSPTNRESTREVLGINEKHSWDDKC